MVGGRVCQHGGIYARHDLAIVADGKQPVIGDLSHNGSIQAPLLKDSDYFILPAFLGDHQHPLLGFGHQHLPGLHPRFPPRDALEFNIHSHPARGRHLRGGAGYSRRAHVFEAHDGPGFQNLQAGLDETFLCEGVSDLDGGTLFFILAELVAGEDAGPADTVPARGVSHHEDGIAFAPSGGGGDLVLLRYPYGHYIYEAIAPITLIELYLTANGGNAQAVAVELDTVNHSGEQVARVRVGERAEAE